MAHVALSEQTAEKIKQLIEKQYKPGSKIPAEMELARFLGVSRTTIREAIKLLCSANIVEIRRGNGTFVCENPGMPRDPFGSKFMDEDELREDTFEISMLLEPELVKLAAAKASDESIAHMRALHEKILDYIARYRGGEYIEANEFRKLDVAFHEAVISGCGNAVITKSLPMFISVCSEWYSVWTSLDFAKVLESFEEDHRVMLDAVEAHDPDAAYDATLMHTKKIIDIYKNGDR